MSESLKEKTAKGLLWGGISNGMQQLLNLFFGIFLARLLTPDDYGMVGMLSIFTAIAGTIQEGGFITALTNRKKTSHKDYNAVFWFSSIMGVSMYTILYFCAPIIAEFYNQPELVQLSRFSFLGFVIASISIAPYAYLFKNLKAKESAIISLSALSISGIIGIFLAYNGFAYWSIVGQSLTFITIITTLRFYYSKWHPTLSFSIIPIKEMLGFSSKLIITNLFNVINSNLFSVLLGKFYNEKEVGFFNQANKWNIMGHSLISGMINGVAQPTLTTLCQEKGRQLNALRKMLRFTAFVSFPAMFGLGFTAFEFITITITEKWASSVLIMQILCIGGAFYPINNLLSNLIISRGKSSIYMWNTITLSLIQLCAAFILYPYGLNLMLYVFVFINIAWMFVWVFFVKKEIGLTSFILIKDIIPYLFLTTIIVIGTHFITVEITNIALRLFTKIFIVGISYISILWILKSTILQETITFIFKRE